jgi:two-component system LytT family sensor kinase
MSFERMSRRQLFWLLHIGGWSLFGVAMALSRLGRYPVDYMIATKFALAALGFVVSLPLHAFYKRWLGTHAGLLRVLAVSIVASYLVALVWSAAYNLADAAIASRMLGRRISVDNLTELFSESLYHAFTLLAWSVLYLVVKRQMELSAARERLVRAEALAADARLQALRFQLQPHFVFNTLNAISTLIVEQRTEDASRMVSRLSDFLRVTLDPGEAHEIPLHDELQLAERYLDIERVRFGDRLRVTLDVDASARAARVPTLLLQPLLENAVRHGVSPKIGGAAVNIAARRDGSRLRIVISDVPAQPGERVGASNGNGRGIGLRNTRQRLEQLYGGDSSFHAAPSPSGGFDVVITLPWRDASDTRAS